MNKIWFTSDPHYFHKNIAGEKVSNWKTGYRDFDDEQQMSRCIVDTWNKYVKSEDELWCLGDWAFGGLQNIWNFRKQLNCENIHLIYGNHDHHIEVNKQLVIPVTDRELLVALTIADDPYKRFNGFSHINAQDLFCSVQYVKHLTLNKQPFFLSHYGHRVWEGSHRGPIHLYGHSHGNLPDFGKSMDCGIDVAKKLFGEYRPFSLEEILQIMNKKQIEWPDHHDINTNIR